MEGCFVGKKLYAERSNCRGCILDICEEKLYVCYEDKEIIREETKDGKEK